MRCLVGASYPKNAYWFAQLSAWYMIQQKVLSLDDLFDVQEESRVVLERTGMLKSAQG